MYISWHICHAGGNMTRTRIRAKPITIGSCSRGFLVPKNEIRLKADKEYIVDIVEANSDGGIEHEITDRES